MKHYILAMSLALASSVALAQPGGPDGGKGPSLAKMQQQLDLTDEQMATIREIQKSGGDRAEVRAVLTPEQQAKAAELKKARKNDRAERRTRMQQELGLSDEQVAKMAEIRKAGGSREEVHAVLTPEQQAKLEEMRANRPDKKGKKDKAAATADPAS